VARGSSRAGGDVLRHTASSTAAWDRLAARYGAQEQLEHRALDAALHHAAVAPGERLVDLGTGTGLLLRRLARSATAPGEVLGVDRSQRMLDEVGPLPPGWSTVIAAADDVPRPDGWADVVTCAYLLHLLAPAERGAVLAEARRLLAAGDGARLVVVTPWSERRLMRGPLTAPARARPSAWGGLQPLDPSRDLARAGFVVTRRFVLPRHGYPSLILTARPAFSSS